MRRLFQAAVITLTIFPSLGVAQDFDIGLQAARSGGFATALANWNPLGEQGDAEAQFNLGIMHDNGDGVPEDKGEAVRWNRLTADQGNAAAQFNLGYMYTNGEGVPQDNVTADMWYNLAGANGFESARARREKFRQE